MKENKDKRQPVNWEAVRMLAVELGAREAARRLGINPNTVLSRAKRESWNLPKRKPGAISRAINLQSQHAIKPGDALIAAHEELENATKTALMRTLAKAAQQVAGKEALDISNTAQLRDICLAAARIFGWKGEAQVNVAVNNQVGVVVTEAKRKELQERLRRLQEKLPQPSLPAANTPTVPAPQTQPDKSTEAEAVVVADQEASVIARAEDDPPNPLFLQGWEKEPELPRWSTRPRSR